LLTEWHAPVQVTTNVFAALQQQPNSATQAPASTAPSANPAILSTNFTNIVSPFLCVLPVTNSNANRWPLTIVAAATDPDS